MNFALFYQKFIKNFFVEEYCGFNRDSFDLIILIWNSI